MGIGARDFGFSDTGNNVCVTIPVGNLALLDPRSGDVLVKHKEGGLALKGFTSI